MSNNLINNFMFAYMYELELFLSKRTADLKSVSFQSDEANTDKPLKDFMKNLIESEFNCIPQEKYNFNLTIFNNGSSNCINFIDFKDIRIQKVLLPDELTSTMKFDISASKNSVYTNPDLYFEITDGIHTYYRSIELKSTKNNSIPGSSIQQVNPDEWVIFVKHSKTTIEVTTGQYIHSINSKLQFPDRSPRPQVAFSELNDWNSKNRVFNNSTLSYSFDIDDEQLKYELIEDWQEYLSDRWIDVVFSKTKKTNEPWFNNNLRKFIINFLERYDSLSDEEKSNFKSSVNTLIEKNR